MRIATYNIWNSEEGMPKREQHLVDQIIEVGADVVCLQEVRDRKQAEMIARQAGYPYCFFDHYMCESEGLCVLSKVPFMKMVSWIDNCSSLFCSIRYDDKLVGVVNLHLPWDSVIKREQQIRDLTVEVGQESVDYVLMAGDFNCSDMSDVQRFLMGDCLLGNVEANPRWYDLAVASADRTGVIPESTLEFSTNPRFKDNTIESDVRVDRILLRNTYPIQFPRLNQYVVFGKKIYEDIELCASDHYGVVAELEWKN